jgi:hypothetical protein
MYVCMYVCMYVYSRGGPPTAPAPRPSLIYCAFLRYLIFSISKISMFLIRKEATIYIAMYQFTSL